MARYDVPRPKRSDYTHRTFSGKWFDRSAYESAVAEWQRGRDEFNERQRLSSRGVAETAGLVGEALIAGATLYGQATTPPEPPNTGQLDDSQSSQHDRWRDSTNEASNQRSRPGTDQPK